MSAEAKASRPQGIPPNGQPDRQTSTATHSAAVHTGQPRRRDTAALAPPSGTKKAVSRVESMSQASQPTDRIQNRWTNMKAAPVSEPEPEAAADPHPVDGQREAGHAHRQQHGQLVGLEGQRQRQAGEHRDPRADRTGPRRSRHRGHG